MDQRAKARDRKKCGARRGGVGVEQLCVLLVVAVVGAAGLSSFGRGAATAIAGDATASTPSHGSHSLVVSRQAGLLGKGAKLVSQAAKESDAAEALQRIARRQIAGNNFVTGRALLGPYKAGDLTSPYEGYLGSDFVEALKALRPGQGWIDMGAGRGGAADEFLRLFHGGSPATAPNVTAVAHADGHTGWLAKHFPTFRALYGRYLEDIPAHELGRAKVISDLYGPLSYSPHFDRVLQIYGDQLELGGEIYAHVGLRGHVQVDHHAPDFTGILRRPTQTRQAEAFLKTLNDRLVGLHLEATPNLPDNPGSYLLKLTKTSPTVIVPKLQLHRLDPKSPPRRYYSFVD